MKKALSILVALLIFGVSSSMTAQADDLKAANGQPYEQVSSDFILSVFEQYCVSRVGETFPDAISSLKAQLEPEEEITFVVRRGIARTDFVRTAQKTSDPGFTSPNPNVKPLFVLVLRGDISDNVECTVISRPESGPDQLVALLNSNPNYLTTSTSAEMSEFTLVDNSTVVTAYSAANGIQTLGLKYPTS